MLLPLEAEDEDQDGDEAEDEDEQQKNPVVYVPILDHWAKISHTPIRWKRVNYMDHICSLYSNVQVDWCNLVSNVNSISFIHPDNPRNNDNDKKHNPHNNNDKKFLNLMRVYSPRLRTSLRMKLIYQELIAKALHPSRVLRWIYDDDTDDF
jgi:hypothetical protein